MAAHNSIETVNVIEMLDDDILGVKSYWNDEEGMKAAKARFKALAMERGAELDETYDFIQDGYYEAGTYQLFLVESK